MCHHLRRPQREINPCATPRRPHYAPQAQIRGNTRAHLAVVLLFLVFLENGAVIVKTRFFARRKMGRTEFFPDTTQTTPDPILWPYTGLGCVKTHIKILRFWDFARLSEISYF